MNKIILVIDDDQLQLDWMEDILSLNDYKVLTANNAVKAEEYFNEKQIDLIITDLIMPDKDGIEIILGLKESHKTIPVIAISGGGKAGGPQYLQAAKMLGANTTLTKPIVAEELLSKIKELLNE